MLKNKVRDSIIATATLCALTVGSLPKAEAGWQDAAKLIEENWGSIVANIWSPHVKQVWYHNISPQEREAVQNQYQSRANGVLQHRCIERWNDRFARGGGHDNFTFSRWLFASRGASNGGVDCFIRLPNRIADRFDAAMRQR